MSAPADPTVKSIQLTPEMAQSLSPKGFEAVPTGGAKRRSRRRRDEPETMVITKEAKVQEGAGATSPGTMVQLAASHVPGNASHAVGTVAPLSATGAPIGTVAPAAPSGGAKVVLAKSRKTKKVVLAAPKPVVPQQRKKTAKKVRVSLKGLGAGLRRAKTIRKKAAAHTVEEIKKELMAASLIKADSKAPESILRQMYADFMTLKKRAL